jgi:hypothetical protein
MNKHKWINSCKATWTLFGDDIDELAVTHRGFKEFWNAIVCSESLIHERGRKQIAYP